MPEPIFSQSFAIVAYYRFPAILRSGYVRAADRGLLWLNRLFLFTIVVLPFSVAVPADYPLAAPAIPLYGANVVSCAATLSIAWWYAIGKRLSIDGSLWSMCEVLSRFEQHRSRKHTTGPHVF